MQKGKLFNLIMALLLVAGLIGYSAPKPVNAASRLHSVLAEMASQNPAQTVRIIVQKADETSNAEQKVAQLGGQVIRDLSIINAFSAEMTAEAAVELARSGSVRWVSLDAPVRESGGPDGTVNTANLLNAYNRAVRADMLWAEGYQGSSVTVAVIDSGINYPNDLNEGTPRSPTRIIGKVDANSSLNGSGDGYGHGTHVAGIIGGNGTLSNFNYVGIAPKVKLVNVKISDSEGMAMESDVVNGLQWVLENRTAYNIRVVNISLNSSMPQSYNTSPLDAACEILWFNGIVVVVSAGNNGSATLYPPANDPFVITVGATDDKGTASIADDGVTSFSAYGFTESFLYKPELVAPGKNIVSLSSGRASILGKEHSTNKVGTSYFRMSGTSMAAPVVSGAVALLLQDEPNLTPDQVKFRLMYTANRNWAGYSPVTAGAGYLDIYAAVKGTTTLSANTGFPASQLLTTGSDPITWGSVGWNSVGWNSVGWNSVGWNSVGWNSVGWNSDYWGP
jgi:serine protease AprX